MHHDGPSPNYDFVIDTALALAGRKDATVLDFGCGGGTFLDLAIKRGTAADFRGVDTYEGIYTNWSESLPDAVRDRVSRIEDGSIPAPDGTFDVVVSNQVFEHVAKPPASLAEIARVLKPGGAFLALFPTRDVWFEGHVGVYFAHRVTSRRWQRRYLRMMRGLGFGYHKEGLTEDQWADSTTSTLQEACFYHTRSDVDRWWTDAFGGAPRSLAGDYMRFRLSVHPKLRPLAVLCDWAPALMEWVCHKRAGRILLARKPA